MKRINYFNRELKEDIDPTLGITDDSYEIKPQIIEIEDKDLDYHLNIINTSYKKFGDVVITDGENPPPTTEERLADIEIALAEILGV